MAVSIPIEQLGPELKRQRATRGSSLRDVEDATGISASTLSRIERGHPPDLKFVEKLAAWLGVNVSAVGEAGTQIRTDDDLVRAIEVHLRANKNLPEELARTIANTYDVVMRVEIEKAKRKDKA